MRGRGSWTSMNRLASGSSGPWLGRVVTTAAVLVIAAAVGLPARAGQEGGEATAPVVVSPPVTPFVVDVDLRDLPSAPDWQPGMPVREVPRREFHPPEVIPPEPGPHGDPLADLQRSVGESWGDAFTTPSRNFTGFGYQGVDPSDPVGDVGPNHYIHASNAGGSSVIRIYDKAEPVPNLLANTTMSAIAGGTGSCSSGYGDPVVIHDQFADRWLLTEFASGGNTLCVYMSQTADPVAGGWYVYQFNFPSFPDYHKWGVWRDAYGMAANESSPSAYAFDRSALLAGAAATYQRFTAPDLSGFGFQTLTPADTDGPELPPAGSPIPFIRHIDNEAHSGFSGPGDYLQLWFLHVDWATPGNSTFTAPPTIQVAEFDSALCGLSSFYCIGKPGVPQGSSSSLDPLREPVMYRFVYRNFGDHETLVGNLATDVNGADLAGVRWFELRGTGSSWGLFQEGTYSLDTVNRWMGSIAMDGSGNIAMGYSVSNSTSVYPGLRYAGRLAGDPPGTLPQGEASIFEASSNNGSNRWGDYASINVDPADDCTFWFTGMFGGPSSGQWSTRIASFKFDQCGCLLNIAPPTASAAVGGDNLILVSWDDSATPEISEYRVYRSYEAGGPYELVGTVPDSSPGVGGGAGYTYQDFDVSGGTTYFYVIRSSDGGSCLSDPSNEASATATGECTLAPLFAGLESVVNPASSQCTLELAWSPATSRCGGSVTYNVYRSTSEGFIPDPSNRVATGIAGTTFADTANLASGTRHYYVVRGVDSVNGAEEQNTEERSGVPTGPYSIGTLLDDAGDTGDATMSPSSPWSMGMTGGHNGPRVYLTGTYGDNVCASLTSAPLRLGAGSTLTFWSKYEIESGWDKGVVEISSDGGSTWAKVPVNYPGNSTNTGDACGLPTGAYFTGSTTGLNWAEYTASLAAWPDQDVILRWRLSTDGSVTYQGWWVDEIAITNVMVPGDCETTSMPFADGFESGDTSSWSTTVP